MLHTASLTGSGEVVQGLPARKLDARYNLMPLLAKQIGPNQLLVPCMYNNHICFANIIF